MDLDPRSYTSEYPLREEGKPYVVRLHSKRFRNVVGEGEGPDIDTAYTAALQALTREVAVHEQAAELQTS